MQGRGDFDWRGKEANQLMKEGVVELRKCLEDVEANKAKIQEIADNAAVEKHRDASMVVPPK